MTSFISLLLLFNFFVYQLCYAADTITHNKVLRDGDTLVSNGGIFALGFFSPGNSKQRYLGIWYNQIPGQTVVWVANRDNPINNSSSGVFKIDELGKLAIFNTNSSPNPVWSTNISSNINSSTLFYKLLDTGNLVLRDESRGDILWQSFDYPTDAFLPGMKLGFNKKTGLSWSLTSWKSPDDPSTGEFTLGMDLTGLPEMVIKKASQKIWRSGPWAGEGFEGVPGMGPNPVVNFSFVDNPDEIYYSHSYYNTNTFSRIMFDYLGFDRTLIWIESTGRWVAIRSYPDDICDSYGKCGAFGSCRPNNQPTCLCVSGFEPNDGNAADGSTGCVRKRELLCGEGDGFFKLENTKFPDTSNARVDMSLGIKECEIECRNNCSCTGFASAYVNGSGCLVWFGDLTDMREFTNGGQDFFVRVNALEIGNSTIDSKGSFTKKKLVLILCVVSCKERDFKSNYLCLLQRLMKKQILNQTRSTPLDWKMRSDIILGIARGVLYLHQDSTLTIIHRDLKASNILLDSKMNPKISDFGMARIFGGDQSQANTRRVVGTYGYMSPEYAMDGFFSIKSDVFSFGVILLEIISGKKNSGFYHEDPTMNLIKLAWELWIADTILELVDPSMGNSFREQEVVRFIQVGILCIQENAKDRPTMSDVIFMLGNETPIPSLKQPAFVLTSNPDSANAFAGSALSVNEVSITIVEGRNNPVYDSSHGVMKFDGRRNLAIFNGNATDPVWSTNSSVPIGGSSTVCKLLDSGNLVLLEQNKGGLLWQSFDHPTNTLLPGMKVGLSFKSGLNWSFTSWKSRDDPSIGNFVLSLKETMSPEIFLKKGSTLIWRSGPWNGESWSGVPLIMHFEKSFMNNPDEVSFSFSMLNTSIRSRIFMDDLGFIQRWNWVEATRRWSNDWSAPADLCDDYGKCGSFGSCKPNNALLCPCLPGFEPKYQVNWNFIDRTPTQGCVRKRALSCGNGDGFLKLEKIKLPDTSNARVDMSLGIKDCEIECRNNCSCTGYASADINRSGCLVWFGDLVDIREYTDGGQDFFVKVDAIELENSMRHSKGSFTKKKLTTLASLTDETRRKSLDWKMRYDIILGIARGVLYLHQDSRLRIIHRDLKASNVLLDSKMNPKISDFGMARIFGGDQSQANTRRVVGTYGYMSPEYAMDGLFSIKSDVFSFGVLLLEIISGKKNSSFYQEDPSMNLIKHTWELWKDGRILELVDPAIGNSFPKEVVRFIQVGILCVQEKAKDRPTMSDVIFMLRNETPIPSLKQPAFVLTSSSNSANASAGPDPSLNEMTTTIVEGR
ncbi:hypothetical protein Sjap_025399 [Stephania japonica]|uniref:Uncharacterized protein n=1 Tax=Stephania japonica TaxID=461633 RepID=A0AAP0HE65_9MAGN